MKKNWFKLALFISLPLISVLSSCEDEEGPGGGTEPGTDPVSTLGAYIVNTGNWGANDGTLQWYDLATRKVSDDLYAAQNGGGIGDLQDVCVYGSKLYVLSTTSSKLEILERNGKLVKSFPLNTSAGQPMNPRYAVAGEGCVFFTAYDGTVSRLDTLTQEVTGSVAVGDYPEALTYAGGKLFVNVSGQGAENKVAVVDVASMSKLQDIEVLLNPYTQCLTGEDGYVYVVSNGNYAGTPGLPEDQWVCQTLQRIDPDTYEVEELCNASYIANVGSRMYILYAEYFLPETHKCFVYDLETGVETILPISVDGFSSPGFIAVDPVSEDIYIGDQPYSSLSTVYVFTKDGQSKLSFETGMYTTNMRFLAE